MDLVTQDIYEKRHKYSTIPTALVKEKEIKQEPIQKNPAKLPNKENYRYRKTSTKEKRLGIPRTTKLDTTTQMSGKHYDTYAATN